MNKSIEDYSTVDSIEKLLAERAKKKVTHILFGMGTIILCFGLAFLLSFFGFKSVTPWIGLGCFAFIIILSLSCFPRRPKCQRCGKRMKKAIGAGSGFDRPVYFVCHACREKARSGISLTAG